MVALGKKKNAGNRIYLTRTHQFYTFCEDHNIMWCPLRELLHNYRKGNKDAQIRNWETPQCVCGVCVHQYPGLIKKKVLPYSHRAEYKSEFTVKCTSIWIKDCVCGGVKQVGLLCHPGGACLFTRQWKVRVLCKRSWLAAVGADGWEVKSMRLVQTWSITLC